MQPGSLVITQHQNVHNPHFAGIPSQVSIWKTSLTLVSPCGLKWTQLHNHSMDRLSQSKVLKTPPIALWDKIQFTQLSFKLNDFQVAIWRHCYAKKLAGFFFFWNSNLTGFLVSLFVKSGSSIKVTSVCYRLINPKFAKCSLRKTVPDHERE